MHLIHAWLIHGKGKIVQGICGESDSPTPPFSMPLPLKQPSLLFLSLSFQGSLLHIAYMRGLQKFMGNVYYENSVHGL